MSNIVVEITEKARSLPAEDRARLAKDLLPTLQEDVAPKVEAAWAVKIHRRLDEVDGGKAKLIPAAEVFPEVRRMLK